MKKIKTEDVKTKILIIGSGPAGCTSAIYAARANLNPILIAGENAGGQLTTTTDVENYPGFSKAIQGPWLMDEMIKQAEEFGTKIIYSNVNNIDLSEKPFRLYDSNGILYISDTVIICTGSQAKWLGLKSEKFFQGYGVSSCATCDGFFFKDKRILVVGGGNSAVEEALFLTRYGEVTLIHRRDKLRAEPIMQDRLFKNKKVNILWNHVISEIKGNEIPNKFVTGAVVQNILTKENRFLDAEGIFIAIGHKPNTDIFKKFIKLDNDGYIITKPNSTETNIEGIFAAGDVQDKIYKQAVTAAGTGCMAAIEAIKYIETVNYK